MGVGAGGSWYVVRIKGSGGEGRASSCRQPEDFDLYLSSNQQPLMVKTG